MNAAQSPLFSKASDNWGTPLALFERYRAEFDFTLDGAADRSNALCARYFGPGGIAEDALTADWTNERVWLNPPYSQTAQFLERAVYAVLGDNAMVCVLIPSRTDTRYFHNWIYEQEFHDWYQWVERVDFLKGRVKFISDQSIRRGHSNSAPFPSMIVVMSGKRLGRT